MFIQINFRRKPTPNRVWVNLYNPVLILIMGNYSMTNLNKIKIGLQAAIVIAVALAFISPGSAAFTRSNAFNQTPQQIGRGEWIAQVSGQPYAMGIRFLDAVDNTTAWAVCRDGSGSDVPTTAFSMTTDAGVTWTPGVILPSYTEHGTGNIWGLSGTVAYVTVYNQVGSQDVLCGAYKTSNGGSTWTQLGNYPISFANNVVFFNENDGVVLGDTKDGYFEDYYTQDGGTTWTRVPLANYTGVAAQSGEGGWTGVVDAIGDTVIFGTNLGNVYISNDRGHTYFASFSGIGPGGLNGGVNAIAFKDATHGIVGHSDDSGQLQLYTTSDGGQNWSPISYSGVCYDYDISYCPGTANTYISTGANQALPGASYSLDGGTSWIDYPEVSGTQMMANDFVDGMIGWAGGFATDEMTGGMFMHVPSANPEPALTASLSGGKGFTLKINNVGDGEATGVTYNATISGGLFVKQRTFTGTFDSIAPGASVNKTCAVMGIGFGILKDKPVIKLTVTCSEGKNATASLTAKIVFSKVVV
jgi:photosystem II stability/assembly factor-like uncharacterized protein